ncbi:MAG: glycosyltransferase [Oscillospiraceae bacterium]|nr:glycosyltransferase [Oscillospiraceae bacterium]
MKHILFYIATILCGGAERVLVNLANHFAASGYDVCVVTNFAGEDEYQLDSRVTRYILEESESQASRIVKNVTRIRALRRILREQKPDVAVGFMVENNYRLIAATAGLPMRTVVSVRVAPQTFHTTASRRLLANFMYSLADGVVFQTQEARDFFGRRIRSRSDIIMNQVADVFFREHPQTGNCLIACGRLVAQKNYPMLLRAFRMVLECFPEEMLRIYGVGELHDTLVEQAQQLGIAEHVQFMGHCSDMPAVLQEAKLLVMTSDYEGMPNAVLEALASSVPVISTDCLGGGPRDVIREGENGYLVPVGDDAALAERICSVLGDPQALARLREGAGRSAQAFRSETVFTAWRGYLERVCGEEEHT